MRSMVYAARVERRHPWLDVVLTEEITIVVEQELVVIGVAMEERDAQGVRIFFERARQKAADDGAARNERRMCARGEMRPMAHDRAYVAHVDLPHRQVTL